MKDSNSQILQKFITLLDVYIKEASNEDSLDTMIFNLLSLHQVLILLLQVHEDTLLDCGLTQVEIDKSTEIINNTKDQIMLEMEHGFTMKGGDA